MKIIYEFDPYEDKEELEVFRQASANHCKLHDIEMYIRNLRKYDEREIISIEEVSDAITEILNKE
jgi:hypothetical protein